MKYRETVAHGRVHSDHVVQLFDSADSLALAVSGYLQDGLRQGDALLVVITDDHWEAVAGRLRNAGVAFEPAVGSGQLTVRGAADTLRLFTRHGVPDPDLFDRSIGALVRQLTGTGRRLRIFGEMVDLLVSEADYRGAQLLEGLWNDLGERESFTLFCGYSSVNFGDRRTAPALHAICHAHSRVRSNPRDVLACFLLDPDGTRAPSDPILDH